LDTDRLTVGESDSITLADVLLLRRDRLSLGTVQCPPGSIDVAEFSPSVSSNVHSLRS
jgi:hypothetical protein